MTDFFISYTGVDRAWAEWIAWQLQEAGYTLVLQAWDFRPSTNFVQAMHEAALQADRTIAVLSPDYLTARFTQPEWQAAFAQDPTGEKGLLVPVRVRGVLRWQMFYRGELINVYQSKAAATNALIRVSAVKGPQ